MPDPIPDPEPRLGKSAKDQIAELTRISEALVKAIKDAEKILDEPLMPTGVYHGVEFKD